MPTAKVFMPINELENLLWGAATGGKKQGAAFQAAMLEHDLFAATPKPMPAGSLGAGDKVELITVEAPGGLAGIALFTSLERLVDTFPQAGYVQVKGSAMLELVKASGVVLNFRQPHTIAWTPEALGRVLEAARPRLV